MFEILCLISSSFSLPFSLLHSSISALMQNLDNLSIIPLKSRLNKFLLNALNPLSIMPISSFNTCLLTFSLLGSNTFTTKSMRSMFSFWLLSITSDIRLSSMLFREKLGIVMVSLRKFIVLDQMSSCKSLSSFIPVSYTHLTLPTICSV
eukprot:TRINITY_DN11020_c0_g1_i4.p1 TRINITY_DN11020_c0_g1~~TRINITY_DN11020_c0_g1_i4.p1  ORF type:complete len:149 (+),score=0.73 TRINITY_DN11020_c0_g1_i4:462-908(+)